MSDKPTCEKCGGSGWLWGNELDDYVKPDGLLYDDTRYPCDACTPKQDVASTDERERKIMDGLMPNVDPETVSDGIRALLDEARAALERLDARKGEDVNEWARNLANDLCTSTDAPASNSDIGAELAFAGIFDRLARCTPYQRAALFYALEGRWCWDCGYPSGDPAHDECPTANVAALEKECAKLRETLKQVRQWLVGNQPTRIKDMALYIDSALQAGGKRDN